MKVKKILILKVIYCSLFFSIPFNFSLSSAEEKEKEKVPVEIKADYLTYFSELKVTLVSGGVNVSYKDVKIKADYLEIDKELDIIYAQGNITFEQEKRKIKGEALKYDLKSEEGIIYQTKGFDDPIYFKGDLIETNPKKSEITNASSTTCDLKKPHYRLKAKKIIIHPEDKVVLKKISFWVGETHLLSFPLYVVSLKSKSRQPFFPQIGYNSEEGFFLKNIYSYYLNPKNYGSLHLDFTQKKGIGKGFEHKISLPREGEMSLYLYHLKEDKANRTNLSTKLEYKQSFPPNLKVISSLNFSNQTTLYSQENKVLNSILKIDKNTKSEQLSLSTAYRQLGGTADQKDLRTNLNHTHFFKDNLTLSSSLSFSSSQRRDLKPNLELNSNFSLKKVFKKNSLEITLKKRVDLDKEKNTEDKFYSVLDYLPEITFQSSPLTFKKKTLPLRLQILLAKYHEGPKDVTQSKGEFSLKFNKPFTLGSSRANITSSLSQAFYDQGSAKYEAGSQINLRTIYSRLVNSNFSYNYQEARGHSPFYFDRKSSFNNINGTINLGITPSWLISSTSGYNFKTKNYQNLISKLETDPKKTLSLNLTAQYDLNNHNPQDLNSRLQIRPDKNFKLSSGTIYDLQRKRWRRFDNELETQITRFWQLQFKSAYNASTHKYIYNDFLLVRDLHCWEAKVSYHYQRRAVWLELNIKAFPTEAVKFGVDEQGMQYQSTLLNF